MKLKNFVTIAMAASLTILAGARMDAGENRIVRIVNQSSSPIRYLFASNVDRQTWEEDVLGRGVMIYPGQYVRVNIDDRTGHCLFDLKAVTLDGREAVRRNFNVCTQSSFTLTD